MPTKPEFEIGDKLKSYTAEWKGSEWEIKGETWSGQKFNVRFRRGDQHEKYSGARCLNWKDLDWGKTAQVNIY